MSDVIFKRTYQLNDNYDIVKQKAFKTLGNFADLPGVYQFNDENKSISFGSERLIPKNFSGRPRVILLLPNPHPYSVNLGMLFSPRPGGRENPVWETLRDSGWLTFNKDTQVPLEMAEMCVNVAYKGPYDFIFYPYYAFPSVFPKDIKTIFGSDFFNKIIAPEAKNDFVNTIQETNTDFVVAFNKDQFNLFTEKKIDKFIDLLIAGQLIESQVKNSKKDIPIFLTYPTGWRYHKDIKRLKKENLELIGAAINNYNKAN